MKTKLIRVSWLAVLAVLAGVLPGAAQSTAFTYQGRITNNGTNFTGTGQFEFSLAYNTNTSSQASASVTAVAFTGDIESIGVNYGGNGYLTPPLVTITSAYGGSGATATATVTGGVVTGINIVDAGTDYPSPQYQPMDPTIVTIAPPPSNYTNISVWNNDGTSGSEPVSPVSVGVTNGLFTVAVGNPALPNMTAIPEPVFLQTNLLLQMWFNDGVDGWAALNPAQALTATPYATFANTAGSLSGYLPSSQLIGSVPTSQLSGSVPAASLSGAVPASSLTSVPAGNLTGAIADGRLSANVALRAGGNAFTGNQNITSGYLGIGLSNPTYPLEVASNGVAKMTMDYAGNLECSGTIYSKGQALTSDRNLKENFQPVDNRAVLAKVAALPVTEWNYKSDSQAVHHMGPMAQDFQAAFGLDGTDDKHISVVDEGGVALAAIQGLDQNVAEKEVEIQALKQQNAALAAQLQALAAVVKSVAGRN